MEVRSTVGFRDCSTILGSLMSSKIQTFYESISLSSFGAIFLLFSLLKLTLPYLLRNKTWQKSHFLTQFSCFRMTSEAISSASIASSVNLINLSDDVFVAAAERFQKLAYKGEITAKHPIPYTSSK